MSAFDKAWTVLKAMSCDMCGATDESVGHAGPDKYGNPIKVCEHCDVDGQDYAGWSDLEGGQ